MAERNAAVGYAAIKKETTVGVAVTPNVYVPYYKQDMVSDFNVVEDDPVIGNLMARYQTLQGHRTHKGTITIMCEANSLGFFMDMLASKISTTGAGPYTHIFKDSIATAPNSYTLDISYGSQVVRFFGCQAEKVSFDLNGDKWTATFSISALGSFYGREIASTSTTTVVLKSGGNDYDPTPTDGLVVSDLIFIQTATNLVTASLSTTVASGLTATQFVAGATAAAFAAGDFVRLRPATPSYSLLQPFLWTRTQFFFAADAATALTNSSTVSNQTRLDQGTSLAIMNPFVNSDGENRSGDMDPAALLRTEYDVAFKAKVFFDTAEQIKYWNANTKRALVVRMYTGATNQYEQRITLNNIVARSNVMPTEAAAPIYHTIDYAVNWDPTDSQGFAVTEINNISTI